MQAPIPKIYEAFLISRSLTTDTRSLQPGQMYLALKGPNFNGNEFAAQALENGAAFVVVDEEKNFYPEDPRYFLVEDGLRALQALSHHHRNTLPIPFIALTGSNGKTTTKELIAAVLSTEKRIHVTKGNLNNHIGVPLTLLEIAVQPEIAIIEMGANKPGDIKELCDIADPTHGLITNVGKAHLELMGGLDGVQKTKGELFDHIRNRKGMIWTNVGDERVRQNAEGISRQLTYNAPDADYQLISANFHPEGMNLEVRLKGGQTLALQSSLTGSHNATNVLAAVAVGHSFGVSPEGIRAGIAAYQSTNNRSQVTEVGGKKIFLDAYNANPSSMEAAIRSLFSHPRGNVCLVLGDMLEMGKFAEQEHRKLLRLVNEFPVRQLIAIGPEMVKAREECKVACAAYASVEEAKANFPQLVADSELIFFKGSRGIAVERLLNSIKAE